MPVETSIWRLGEKVEKVPFVPLALESKLQQALEQNLSILDPGLMLVGKQVSTENSKIVDLLAIDSEGELHVIELKRHAAPRNVVAQALDYAAWVKKLGREEIAQLYADHHGGQSLAEGFLQTFDLPLPDVLNAAHNLIIVAAEIDPATERIVQYLVDYSVPINVVFFRHFKVGQDEYLVRSWLIDPDEVAEQAEQRPSNKKKQPWNKQDYYVVFGESSWRTWEDAVRYGFVSAGGKRTYTRPLEKLQPGRRISVYIPKTGYVGVGIVTTSATPIKDFTFTVDGVPRTAKEVSFVAYEALHDHDNPEQSEWLVGVKWQQVRPKTEALSGGHLFSNQTIVCQLRDETTLKALAEHFPTAFGDGESTDAAD